MKATAPAEPSALDAVAAELEARRDLNQARLCDLVRIPSVSARGFDPAAVRTSAEMVADLAMSVGLRGVELLEISGSHPFVYGERTAEHGAPTVLLYAHHDVQPPGSEGWTADPFEPVERDGRLYGRGTADDKAGIMVHMSAVEVWLRTAGQLPLNVKLLVDGEEEAGNPALQDLLANEGRRLRCDAVVVADLMNLEIGRPTITCSLRGVVSLVVELRGMERPVHSGYWGGVTPDPVMALARLVATLVDERGAIAVDGFLDDLSSPRVGPDAATGPQEADIRRHVRLRPGVSLCGDPDRTPAERLWWLPSLTVIAVDAPPVTGSSNAIQAAARARISVRLGPGQDPVAASERIVDHLRGRVPWGLQMEVEMGSRHRPWFRQPTGPVFECAERAFQWAFGAPVTYAGMGGTVPLVSSLAEALGDVPCLLTAVEDPDSQAHGPDESVHLEDWHRACLAEAALFDELARVPLT